MVRIRQLKRSFSHAFKGLYRVASTEQNFRIQLVVAAAVVVLMFVLGLSTLEMALLTLAIMLVLVLELMNSIFERMADMLKPRIHHYVRDVKDIMAGTVLIAAVGAFLIGLLIFWPYLMALSGTSIR